VSKREVFGGEGRERDGRGGRRGVEVLKFKGGGKGEDVMFNRPARKEQGG